MKKRFLITAALIGLLTTCREPAGNLPDNIIDPNQKAVIVFDNTQGICAAAAFNDYRRRDEDKIAEIPAGASSREIEWTPGTSVPFYFSYRINLKGISGFTLNYTPKEVGKDQTAVRIDADTKTTITIPKLEETLSSPDTLLTNDSFLLIQNNSSYSFQLHQGSSQINPDSSPGSALVNPGERAQYTINPGSASNYQLLVGANYVTLPGSLVSFAAGRVYNLVFDGGVYLASEVEIKLENVAGVSPNNPVPEAPGAPVVTASDSLLTVRWADVFGAENYEVYISTTQNPPAQYEKTVPGTTTVLTGLTNKTTYYVWIKAVNEHGSSDFSLRARGIPWPANEVPAVPGRPVIIPGINQLTINWEGSGGASSYEVYINTTTTAPSSVTVTSDKTSAVINNLQNDVIYYIWVRAVNSVGKSAYSPIEAGTPRLPTVAPAAPSRPVLIAGSRELSVYWQAVELASAYEVWFGTSSDPAQAQKYGGDITGGMTETIVTGLTNEQIYYVWIRAKNAAGTSGFSLPISARASAFVVLPETPGIPTVIPGNRELSVSWQVVEGALFYEVWTGTTNNLANAVKQGADVSGTLTTLTNLAGGTTYYVWLKAKNHVGTSGFSPAASGNPGLHELYRDNVKIGNHNFSSALSYISANAVNGDNFSIFLGADETVSPTSLIYTGKTVGITLRGYGGERTITLASNGSMFLVYAGVSLTLDENITLVGLNTNNASLIYVFSGSTLIINEGAKINSNNGGGIRNFGTFTMNGGIISGNYIGYMNMGGGISVEGGTFTMNGGIICGNTAGWGGGVSILTNGNGTFTMNGGIINENTAIRGGGGIYGTFTMNGGTINGNTASENGGGIFVTPGTVTINNGEISGNIANSGGGICVNVNSGIITMNGGTISGNVANDGGGGIVVSDGTVTMNGGTISGNTANGGGGVKIYNTTFTMHGGTISGNSSGNNGGGGVYNASGAFKKLPSGDGQNSGIIYGNEATGVDTYGLPLRNTGGSGHAVSSSGGGRNTTAGQTDHIDTTTGRGLSANGNAPYGN
jgi:hypothetical protein